ncbi:MAG: TVP38/TMEM64 family protein [Bradyrhizobium sp.]
MMTGTTAGRTASRIGLVALLVAVLLAWFLLPAKDWIQSIDAWIGRLGAWGIFIFALAYIALVILLAPVGIMSIAAGLIFGLWGIPLVIVSAAIGATLAFLVSRYFVRERVKAFTQKRDVFRAVDRVLGEEGWKVVVLLRLNPLMPFNLQNYFFGATDIGLLPYAAATLFGIMPGSMAYVYLGTLGQAAAPGGGASGLKIALLGVGLVATIVLVLIVSRQAKIKLKNLGVDKTSA